MYFILLQYYFLYLFLLFKNSPNADIAPTNKNAFTPISIVLGFELRTSLLSSKLEIVTSNVFLCSLGKSGLFIAGFVSVELGLSVELTVPPPIFVVLLSSFISGKLLVSSSLGNQMKCLLLY